MLFAGRQWRRSAAAGQALAGIIRAQQVGAEEAPPDHVCTQTVSPMGIRSCDQMKSMASGVTRTHP